MLLQLSVTAVWVEERGTGHAYTNPFLILNHLKSHAHSLDGFQFAFIINTAFLLNERGVNHRIKMIRINQTFEYVV